MYYVENSHVPIIDRNTFHKAQEELARRRSRVSMSSKALSSVGHYSKYALTDVVTCGECGTRYRRVTWTAGGYKRVVWRCINRLDFGKKYCQKSVTIPEEELKSAIVKAVNQFCEEDNHAYLTLMRATIGEAIGATMVDDESDFLQRRIEALNRKMLDTVNESVKNGADIEEYEEEFKQISDEINALKERIKVIQESRESADAIEKRVASIQEIIDQRNQNMTEYDESIVRQMIECIKVFKGKIEVIFGGGYSVSVPTETKKKK